MRFVYKLKFHTELHEFIKKRHKHVFFFYYLGGEIGFWLNSSGVLQKLHLKGFPLSYCKKQNQTNKHTNNPEHKVTIK